MQCSTMSCCDVVLMQHSAVQCSATNEEQNIINNAIMQSKVVSAVQCNVMRCNATTRYDAIQCSAVSATHFVWL